jgi:hypothetical protein
VRYIHTAQAFPLQGSSSWCAHISDEPTKDVICTAYGNTQAEALDRARRIASLLNASTPTSTLPSQVPSK